jgi:hypothetical protein
MRRLAAFALAVTAALPPSQGAALSCLAPSASGTFWAHQDAKATFVAAFGSFGPLDGFRHDKARDRVTFTATFTGHTARGRAFAEPFSARVRIVQPLWSGIAGGDADHAWLAKWLPGQTGIVYLERGASGYSVTADICAGLIDTDPASVRTTLACLAGGRCPRP